MILAFPLSNSNSYLCLQEALFIDDFIHKHPKFYHVNTWQIWPSKVKKNVFMNLHALNPLNFNLKWVVKLKQIVFWICYELFLQLHQILHAAFIEICLKIELEVSWKKLDFGCNLQQSLSGIRDADPRGRGSRIPSRFRSPGSSERDSRASLFLHWLHRVLARESAPKLWNPNFLSRLLGQLFPNFPHLIIEHLILLCHFLCLF